MIEINDLVSVFNKIDNTSFVAKITNIIMNPNGFNVGIFVMKDINSVEHKICDFGLESINQYKIFKIKDNSVGYILDTEKFNDIQ